MRFDEASLQCVNALPVRLIETSREIGWTSALVEHHHVLDCDDAFETKPTSDQTIVVMTQGEQRLRAHRAGAWQTTLYRPGTVGMTVARATSRLRREVNRDAGPARKVNIYVPSDLLAEAADHLGRPFHPEAPPPRLPQTDEVMRQIAIALLRGVRADAPDFYAESALRWFAAHLFASSDELTIDTAPGPAIERRLRRVTEFVEECFSQRLSVDDLAARAGISKFHFARLFRHAVGTSPYRYITDVRLRAARRMLRETDFPVSEVARRCGFSRANHFTTEFNRRWGTSPSDFRLGGSGSVRS